MSTQGGTTVGIDRNGNAVRPAMVWSDKRCTQELEQFNADMPELDVYRICGWKASAAMPALQCRWLQKHEPENFGKISQFLSVPDYLAWKMTGKAVMDISNAGICRFVDIQTARYHDTLLDYSGLSRRQLPNILPSATPVGKLTQKAAEEMGLSADVQVVSGAHDQYAVALGAGAYRKGDILIGSGTSWVVTSISNKPDFESGLAQSVPAVPGMWGSLRSLSSGGVCLEWWRKNITVDDDGSLLTYDRINEEVAKRKAAEEGLYFFPFSGQSDNRVNLKKASLIGMDLSHDRFHIARAIMEGVAFQIVWMMECFQAKPSKEGIILAGGASKSKLWSQMVADISGQPVRIPVTADLACVGAAVMAGVGCGLFSTVEEGYKKLAVPDYVIQPRAKESANFKMHLEKYKSLSKALGFMYNT